MTITPEQSRSTERRLFDASVKFAIQASEIEEQFAAALLRRLRTIQRRLIDSLGPVQSPRRTAEELANQFNQQAQMMSQDVRRSLTEYSVRAGRAYPRFLNRAAPRREQLQMDAEPFDESDVEREDDEQIVGWFVPPSEQELQQLLLIIAWNGFTVQQQWELWIRRQRLQLLGRLGAELAQRQTELDEALDAPDKLRQEAERILKRNIAGGRGIRIQPNAARTTGIALGRTQHVTVTNEVIKDIIRRNRSLIRRMRWVAILDDSTCLRCANLHNKTFPLKPDGTIHGPQNPLHFRCRCVWVPIPSTTAFERRRVREPMSFVDWFSQQSGEFQRRLLGPSRFRLWKSGGIKFRDFVQFRARVPVRVRTLDSLRRIANA